MDTFDLLTPYPDLVESAEAFDDVTLSRMLLEVLRMLNTLHSVEVTNLHTDEEGLVSVPESRIDPHNYMAEIEREGWKDHIGALIEYGTVLVSEMAQRNQGTHLTNLQRTRRCARASALLYAHRVLAGEQAVDMSKPSWWGNVAVHDAHKGQLVRQSPELYLRWNIYRDSFLEEEGV